MDTFDVCNQKFEVLSSDPHEEFILSDPVASEIPPPRIPTTEELIQKDKKCNLNPLSEDNTCLKEVLFHLKNEIAEGHLAVKKEEPEWQDISIEEELVRFTDRRVSVESGKESKINSNPLQTLKVERDLKISHDGPIDCTLVQSMQNFIVPDIKSEQRGNIHHGTLQLQLECENFCNGISQISSKDQSKRKKEDFNTLRTPSSTAASQTLSNLFRSTTDFINHNRTIVKNSQNKQIQSRTRPNRSSRYSPSACQNSSNIKPKNINVAESEMIDTNKSSDKTCDGNDRDSVIVFCGRTELETNLDISNRLSSLADKICDNSKITCVYTSCKSHKVTINTTDASVDTMSINPVSQKNITERNFQKKSNSLQKGFNIKQKMHRSNFVKPFLTQQKLYMQRRDSKISPSSKGTEAGKSFRVHQFHMPSKHVPHSLLKSIKLDKCTKEANSAHLSNNSIGPVQNLVNLVTNLSSSTYSEDIMESNVLCLDNTNSLAECRPTSQDRLSTNTEVSAKTQTKKVCPICNKSVNRVNKHMQQVHSEERRFACQQCCKAYSCKASLDYHMKSNHSTAEEKFQCKTCCKYLKNSASLKTHQRWAHTQTENNVPKACDICQKVFRNRARMLAHRLRNHNTANKTFICNDCSSVFSDKNKLISHIHSFHMPPKFKCSDCSEYFVSKVKLQAHLRKEHGIDNRKTLVCETCGKTTKNVNAFQNHLKTHSDVKAFVCEECGKSFKTATNLSQHSVIHSDVRRFSCDLCGSSFRIRHHLRQHMAVHGMASTPNYSKRGRRKRTSSSSDSAQENSSDESSE